MHSTEDPDGKAIFYVFRYLISMGISAHDYDYQKKELIYKQWAADYCSVFDCAIVVTAPFYLMYISEYLKCEIFRTRFTAMYLNCFLLMGQFLAIAFSRVGNWIYRKRTNIIFDQLNKIRLTEFRFRHHRYTKIRNEVKNVMYSKILCSWFILLGLSVVIIFQSKDGLFVDIYWAVVAIFVLIVLIAMENQISFAMLYGTYIFKMLNSRLSLVVEEINSLCENKAMHIVDRKTGRLCYELKIIGKIHTAMLRLIIDYKDAVKLNIFFILSTIIVAQVYDAFLLLVLLNGDFEDGEFQKICAFSSFCMAFLDLWLIVYICGEVVDSCNATGKILATLATHNILNKPLETRIQILMFQLMREKMQLMVFEMFNLNWARGFIMTGVALEYLIIMVQSDYVYFDF